jgi:transposase
MTQLGLHDLFDKHVPNNKGFEIKPAQVLCMMIMNIMVAAKPLYKVDGHVPITYQVFNGNQADVSTHAPNWDNLRNFLATEDFVYTADSKLCSENNLHHIEKHGGTFITIISSGIVMKKRLNRHQKPMGSSL